MTFAEGSGAFNFKEMIEIFRAQRPEGHSSESLFAFVVNCLRSAGLTRQQPLCTHVANVITQEFKLAGAEKDLRRLAELGVYEETLFCALLFWVLMPRIDEKLRTMFGDAKERKRKAKILQEAALVMGEFNSDGAAAMESALKKILPDKTFLAPRKTADELPQYANILFFREQILEALNASSGQELAKYTLASTIHRITGKYHDREASAAVGVFLQNTDYDETAHRVWRIRTLPRLNKTASFFPVVLHALNAALAKPEAESQTRTKPE
jgi:hypothetical protein